MLDGSVAEYLSYMQNRKPASSRIFYEYPVPQERDDFRIYCITDIQLIVKW